MKTQKSDYDIQAETFAEKHGLTMKAVYLGHYPRLGEHATSQWQVTLERPSKNSFTFQFSQSIQESWRYNSKKHINKPVRGLPRELNQALWPKTGSAFTAW